MENNNLTPEIKKNLLKQKFKEEYLDNLWSRIKFWFLIRKLYKSKILALWEINMDKLFFESQYFDLIKYDDAEDRKALAEENRKPKENQNDLRINDLEIKIARGKAVKDSYKRNENFRAEVISYITMLEVWMGKESKNYDLK